MPTAARLATTLCIALVASLALVGAVGADPETIGAKRAEAEQVLAEIREMDLELELAIDEWNGANVRLGQIERDLAANERRLEAAQASLASAQDRRDLIDYLEQAVSCPVEAPPPPGQP